MSGRIREETGLPVRLLLCFGVCANVEETMDGSRRGHVGQRHSGLEDGVFGYWERWIRICWPFFFFFTTVRFLFANFNSVVPAWCGGESKPPSDSGSKQSAIVLYVLSFLTQF